MARSPVADILSADRVLHREQMDRFADELPWLHDPDTIPPQAILGEKGEGADDLGAQCYNLAVYMLGEIADWTGRVERQLDWKKTFEKYQVPNEYRVKIRNKLRMKPEQVYAPGLFAMSEIVAVVPLVAARDDAEPSEWEQMAADARQFGSRYARDGTDAQDIIRGYLHRKEQPEKPVNLKYMDPAKFRRDETTGITTVTPIAEIVAVTRAELKRRMHPDAVAHTSGVCVALQAASPTEEVPTMFDATWLSYIAGVGRLIFPQFQIAPRSVPAQEAPDPDLALAVNAGIDRINEELEQERTAK